MALDVAVYSTTLPGGRRSRLGVNMRTLIIIASLGVVLPFVGLIGLSAHVTIQSILNDGANLFQLLLKRRR